MQRSTALFFCLCAASVLPACSLVRSGPERISTQASHDGKRAELSLEGMREVFVPAKAAIADAYLTTLPQAAFEPNADLSAMSGVLVHAHVLTQPKAGRTPIATTATTTTLRLLVLSNGQAGLYAGGGFADFDVDGASLRGRVRGASMRLVRATAGFADVLGPSTLTVDVSASEDAATSAAAEKVLVAAIDAMEALGSE